MNELLTLNPSALVLQNEITEEQIWLANQRTQKTKLSYKNAITAFMECFGFHSSHELRSVKMPLVIAWRDSMKQNGMSNSTICHRLSALKSLFNHLCERQLVQFNPVQGVTYPKVNKTTVSTPAFTIEQARLMLDVPGTQTKKGVRDSAILYVLFYIGCREGAIAKLKVGDFYERTGRFVLDIDEKGENKNTVAIHPELQACLRVYISQLDHKHKKDAPMFIGVKDKAGLKAISTRSIRELFKSYLKKINIPNYERYSVHSARTTFATTALQNGCPVEQVQKTLTHKNIATTLMYDQRAYQDKDSASYKVEY